MRQILQKKTTIRYRNDECEEKNRYVDLIQSRLLFSFSFVLWCCVGGVGVVGVVNVVGGGGGMRILFDGFHSGEQNHFLFIEEIKESKQKF
jgi:hypothetical protein